MTWWSWIVGLARLVFQALAPIAYQAGRRDGAAEGRADAEVERLRAEVEDARRDADAADRHRDAIVDGRDDRRSVAERLRDHDLPF